MKYPQLVSMPSAVSGWLEEQLEARGIDSEVYTRYILSLLHAHTLDVIYPEDDFPLSGFKRNGGRDAVAHKRIRRSATWWRHAHADAEQIKRSAAVECLMSAAEQSCEIESLVDELCEKLKEVNSEGDNSSNKANQDTKITKEPLKQRRISPKELAEKYYAAFPPLNNKEKTSYFSSNINLVAGKWPSSDKTQLNLITAKWTSSGSPKKTKKKPKRQFYDNMKPMFRTGSNKNRAGPKRTHYGKSLSKEVADNIANWECVYRNNYRQDQRLDSLDSTIPTAFFNDVEIENPVWERDCPIETMERWLEKTENEMDFVTLPVARFGRAHRLYQQKPDYMPLYPSEIWSGNDKQSNDDWVANARTPDHDERDSPCLLPQADEEETPIKDEYNRKIYPCGRARIGSTSHLNYDPSTGRPYSTSLFDSQQMESDVYNFGLAIPDVDSQVYEEDQEENPIKEEYYCRKPLIEVKCDSYSDKESLSYAADTLQFQSQDYKESENGAIKDEYLCKKPLIEVQCDTDKNTNCISTAVPQFRHEDLQNLENSWGQYFNRRLDFSRLMAQLAEPYINCIDKRCDCCKDHCKLPPYCQQKITFFDDKMLSLMRVNHSLVDSAFCEYKAPLYIKEQLSQCEPYSRPFGRPIKRPNPLSDKTPPLKQPVASPAQTSDEQKRSSPNMYFEPIKGLPLREVLKEEGDGKLQDGATFNIRGNLDEVKYERSMSGSLFLENELGEYKKYFEYKWRPPSDESLMLPNARKHPSKNPWQCENKGFAVKFRVSSNDKACQTDNTLPSLTANDVGIGTCTLVRRNKEEAEKGEPFELVEFLDATCTGLEVDEDNVSSLSVGDGQCVEMVCRNCRLNDPWAVNNTSEIDNDGRALEELWTITETCSTKTSTPSEEITVKLREESREEGEKLLSDLSSLQQTYSAMLEEDQIGPEDGAPGDEKRRHSYLNCASSGLWILSIADLQENCLINLSTSISSCPSVTL